MSPETAVLDPVADAAPAALPKFDPEVIQDWPPHIDQVRFWLPAVTENNIFAYDRKIYSPSGTRLPPWLIEHEKVHFYQQEAFGSNEDWWDKFLMEPSFRLTMEIPAHKMEWRVWLATRQRSRNERRVTLKAICKRLSSPMYGGIITAAKAKKAILA